MSTDADVAVLRLALSGDRSRLPGLVDRWTPVIQARVVRSLRRLGHRGKGRVRQEIEEFVQQVFVAIFENDCRALRGWQPERGLSLDNWVGLIAERQVLSLVRTKKRNPWTEEPIQDEHLESLERGADPSDPESETIGSDLLSRLLDRLQERLSPLGWMLFQLLYVDECSVREATEASGLSSDAIYAWRSRLRRTARTVFDELMSETGASARTPDRG